MKPPVIAAVDDLFFAAKIKAAAAALGVEVRLGRTLQGLVASALESGAELLIVDLHAKGFDPFALAATLKADAQLSQLTLLGFFSHVQTATMQRAKEVGYDVVLPRSAFSNKLPEILTGKLEKKIEGTG